ncbi:MAG: carboxypeptidase-like regulatory domain-containing protein [Prevotella sp.]|nr:carboxypeptidase-like regulatory domain-containing protein [Prevotella sp.]
MKLTKNRPKTCCRWRSVLTALLLATGLATASAQTQTLTGSVTDAADGEPLMGATIKVKETNAGVVTDLDGHYAVKVDNGQTLDNDYETTVSTEFGDLVMPDVVPTITKDNIFLPYPEADVIQNPYLKEEPQHYNFNE